MSKEHAIKRDVVLVVEDEFYLREDAAWVLEHQGFEVLQAATAEQALEHLAERPDISAVFTDVQMPGEMDGMDLARRIARRWPHILVIVTSGGTRLADEIIPYDGRFIPKPYAPEMVARKLATMIKARWATVQNGVRLRMAAVSVPSSR
jgi:DNA-binding NtrC family response regulator